MNEKLWIQKICQSSVKIIFLKKSMKKLLVKCIEIFLIYMYLIFQSLKWHDCCKYLSSRVHFRLIFLVFCMDCLINHMFRDIHKLAY
jgi:hypothetical protein